MQSDHLRKGQDVNVIQSLVAGSVSGLMSRIVTAPLDTIKIRLQTTPTRYIKQTPSFTTLSSNSNLRLIIREMLVKEGIRSFWKGNTPGSLMYVVYGATQFSTYSVFNSLLAPRLNLPNELHSLIAGMVSGITCSFVSYPFDTLRTRFVANKDKKLFNLKDSCKDIWVHEGVRGFYNGCLTSMVTFTLASGIMFSTYESIKVYSENRLSNNNNRNSNSNSGGDGSDDDDRTRLNRVLSSSASTISAVASKIMTFPIDTVRRRIQLQDSIHLNKFFKTDQDLKIYREYRCLKKSNTRGSNFIKISVLMVKNEGIRSLYKGLMIGLCKSVPATVVSLWTYERVMNLEELISKQM